MRYSFFIFCILFTQHVLGQTTACTDKLASNYSISATVNDGSCIYAAASVTPSLTMLLPASLDESSGLIFWNDRIWSHDDDTDIDIYSINPTNSSDILPYPLDGTINKDWEEISQDANYIYVGDFGNNATGNRKDLKILRVEKSSLINNKPIIDTISFSYSLQTDYSITTPNNTNFDCEAFLISSDSIYLFTKEWISKKSTTYSLPKLPGSYIARYRDEFNVDGLITGATYLEAEKLIVLTGYSPLVQPFLFLLYDYNADNFFKGNKRKIFIDAPFHQVEGITTEDGLMYYISNEKFVQSFVIVEQKIQQLNLSSYLNDYLHPNPTEVYQETLSTINLYPNPAANTLIIESDAALIGKHYSLIDVYGVEVLKGQLQSTVNSVIISEIPSGLYYLILDNTVFKSVIKK